MSTYLSPHFTLEELTSSQAAVRLSLSNAPTMEALQNLPKLALLLEAVRTHLAVPVIVSSGFRSKAVNDAVGGAPSSQHLTGQAADFIAPGFGSPVTVCSHLMDQPSVDYDQLICEGTWVHISWAPKPRRQVLTARFVGGRAHYTPGLS
jgi:hypothetical protein